MLASISTFFDNYLKATPDESESSHEDKLQLASAALLVELSKADQKMDDSETAKLIEILQKKFSLDPAAIENLVEVAMTEAKEATSLYQFTSLFNDSYEYQDKVQLVRNMWELAFADGHLDRYEEHMIRKVADLLYVSHSDFIKTKLSVLNT